MNVISLERAISPQFTPKQEQLCDELIGMGLARLAIASILLNVNSDQLNPSQVVAVNRLISKRYKQLGHTITDSRHARSEFMKAAVQQTCRRLHVRLRIA